MLDQPNAPNPSHGDSVRTGQPVTLTDGIETCQTADGLARLNEDGTELVIWQRTLPDGFREWIEGVDASNLPHFRLLVAPDDLCRALEPLLDDCGLPAGTMRDTLVSDIDGLVRTFAEITDVDEVDIRLESIDHDACWRFHRDTVDARLLTTYRGPATEWVSPTHAEVAIADQLDFEGPLERLGDDDVAIFKGKTAGPETGIVHRSPPIEGTGLTRLLLCLNKQTVVSPSLWREE